MKTAELHLRWADLMSGLHLRPLGESTLELLLSMYGEPGRAYHNIDHIAECLVELDDWRHVADEPGLIEAALWFHDAVYDPRRQDNEALSANLAAEKLDEAGLHPTKIEYVIGLILATSHRAEPASSDGRLIADIDLAIFGKNADRFDNYHRAIRLEYAHVPEEAYRQGRLAVLERFLARPTIFRVPEIAARYEVPARVNLSRAIDRLRAVGRSFAS